MRRVGGNQRGNAQLRLRMFLGWLTPAMIVTAGAGTLSLVNPLMNEDRTYAVNKRVSGFPTNEDFSTPEAAYASIHCIWSVEGDTAWRRLSVRSLASRLPGGTPQPLPAARAEQLLNTDVLEVHVFGGTNAGVFGEIHHPRGENAIDIRWFGREEGRWLNSGNDVAPTLKEARKRIVRRWAWLKAEQLRNNRPGVANPDEYLRRFVEFLNREASDPQDFILNVLSGHDLVILGEVHHRPKYWAFNCGLVRTPEFARHTGVIYLELPANDQLLINRFLAATYFDSQPVIETLRDMMEIGWPDQPMLDFFKAVWETNQKLAVPQRLRIVLVDMNRPWRAVQTRADLREHDVDRDEFMATNISRDRDEHSADPRHALFIVGYGHALLNLHQPDGEPMRTAGWHLRERLGASNVFAVFPHSPVMHNVRGAQGRLALGLFDSAFAAVSNRCMAFPLDHGPFGEQLFDADVDRITADLYREAFDAFLSLGPLEEEDFAPLIPGFYSEEFVREIDRRLRLLYGHGLLESGRVGKLDGPSIERWLSQTWGQPRQDWKRLVPLNAWHFGSEGEKQFRPAPPSDPGRDAPLNE